MELTGSQPKSSNYICECYKKIQLWTSDSRLNQHVQSAWHLKKIIISWVRKDKKLPLSPQCCTFNTEVGNVWFSQWFPHSNKFTTLWIWLFSIKVYFQGQFCICIKFETCYVINYQRCFYWQKIITGGPHQSCFNLQICHHT